MMRYGILFLLMLNCSLRAQMSDGSVSSHDQIAPVLQWACGDPGQSLDTSKLSDETLTLEAQLRIPKDASAVRFISVKDEQANEMFRLFTRSVVDEPAGDRWDEHQQNYVNYTRMNPMVLECEVRYLLPSGKHTNLSFVPNTKLRERMEKTPGLRVGVPLSLVDAQETVTVTLRVNEIHLELFVNGVLVDEEWPVGRSLINRGPLVINTEAVSQCRIWNHGLSDGRIAHGCGGQAAVDKRRDAMFGPQQTQLQYWAPRGFNCWAGDPMCFFHDGRYHIFYLFDRRHHTSKWGNGGHQFAHLSTTDLRHWEHHPMAVPTEEPWFTVGTGSCLFFEGQYHLFYGMHSGRMAADNTRDMQIKAAQAQGDAFEPIAFDAATKIPRGTARMISRDGIHFTKERITLTPAENMFVFQDPDQRLFHMIEFGKVRYQSKDLKHWQIADRNFLPTGKESPYNNSGECPCYFEWNGWHYILMGRSGFWMSRQALGPYWPSPSNTEPVYTPRWDIYDGLIVPQVAAFTDNRRILSGFLWGRNRKGGRQYAGHLVFRELIQWEDGTLGMKWPDEMIPAYETPVSLNASWVPLGASYTGHTVTLNAKPGDFQYVALGDLPETCRISLLVDGHQDAHVFGLCLRGSDDYQGGCELQFDKNRNCVQWATPQAGNPAKAIPIVSDGHVRYARHDGYDFALPKINVQQDQSFKLDIIVKQDTKSHTTIIDACIDHRRTMVTRRCNLAGRKLCLFVKDGCVSYRDISVLAPGESTIRSKGGDSN